MKRKVLAVTSISKGNQTSVPKKIRDILGLKDSIMWVQEGNRIYVERAEISNKN